MSRPPALSASRAKEYLQCPLKFRYSVVDGLPQPPTEATIKGNVVHKALEDLFNLAPSERIPEAARTLLEQAWEGTLQTQQQAREVFSKPEVLSKAQSDTVSLIENYFSMEMPWRLNPVGREMFIDARLTSGLLLRGIVDRIDEAPDGALRVVDYKTGKAPAPRFVEDALFQMRFYALLLREQSVLPRRLQILFLRSQDVLTLDPDEQTIDRFEMQVDDLWNRIEADARNGQFRPQTSKLCGWCAYQQICPAFGAAPTSAPREGIERLLTTKVPPKK